MWYYLPRGTFRVPQNYRTESVLFDIMEDNLPFNAILGRPALYQFMVVTHYGYLVLKMLASNDIIKIRGDRTSWVSALEKLQALAAAREATARQGDQEPAPSNLRQRISTSAPCV
jgi:hypothetical protein